MDSGTSTVDGIVYTFKNAKKPPKPGAWYYKITCYVPYVNVPIQINTYYVPGSRLDEFFINKDEIAEVITDIRPLEEGESIPKATE